MGSLIRPHHFILRLSRCPLNEVAAAKLCWKRFSTPVTPLPPPPGRSALLEELPHGEGRARGVGVT